jgi:hypothetical protein
MANVYFGLLTQFKALWEKKYPGQKFYPQKYHYKQLKERMAPAEGFEPIPPEEVVKRMRVYLRTDYWKICKHNFSKFVEYFDNFIPQDTLNALPKLKQIFCTKCEFMHYEGYPCMCHRTEKEIALLREPQPIGDIIDNTIHLPN